MPEVPVVKDFRLLFLLRMKKNFLQYTQRLHERYGDIFTKYFKGTQFYYLRQPRHVEHVLFTNDENYRKPKLLIASVRPFIGDNNLLTNNNLSQWKHDRQVANMAFDSAVYFDSYVNDISTECQKLINQWQIQSAKQRPLLINIRSDFSRLILNILKTTIFYQMHFDEKLLADNIPLIASAIREKSVAFTHIWWSLPTPTKRRYQKLVDFANNTANGTLDDRLAQNKNYDDLLGMILREYPGLVKNSPEYKAISNHIKFYYVVGSLSTESAISWTLVLLAQFPEIKQKIKNEIDQICQGRPPTYAEIGKLRYLQATLCEVLRLYPPIIYFFRECIDDDVIGGYPIPKNATLIMNNYFIHRHPEYWERPETFDPERFINHPFGQSFRSAYLPFGGGKRTCIGKNFAFIEICTIIAMFLQNFNFDLLPNEEVKIQMTATLLMRPNVQKMLLTVK